MPEKPTLMWHADKDGRCHQKCEAWVNGRGGFCRLLERMAWEVFDQPTPAKSWTCPFALLSSVLCCGKAVAPTVETMEDFDNAPLCDSCRMVRCRPTKMQLVTRGGRDPFWRCPVCRHETWCTSGELVGRGIRAEDHRCGTCGKWKHEPLNNVSGVCTMGTWPMRCDAGSDCTDWTPIVPSVEAADPAFPDELVARCCAAAFVHRDDILHDDMERMVRAVLKEARR